MTASSVLAGALLLAAGAQASAQGDMARRFQGLDRDGDGVLAGDEVRPGARRSARQDRPGDGYYGGEPEFDDWTVEGFD